MCFDALQFDQYKSMDTIERSEKVEYVIMRFSELNAF